MSFHKNDKPKYNIDYNFNPNLSKNFTKDSVQAIGSSADYNNKNTFTIKNSSSQAYDKRNVAAKLTKTVINDTTRNQAQKVINFNNKMDAGCRILSLKLNRAQQVSKAIKNGIIYEVIGQIENVDYNQETEMINFYIRDGNCVQKSVFCNMDNIEFDINLNAVYRFVGFFNSAIKSCCFQCCKIIAINDEEFKIIKLFEVQSEKQLQLLFANISEI